MHGKGKLELPNGCFYEGEYRDDRKEGFGVFTWPDGRRYEGDWVDGKQEGEGWYIDEKKGVKRKAQWKAGRRLKWLEN
jgi:hypothetical protein